MQVCRRYNPFHRTLSHSKCSCAKCCSRDCTTKRCSQKVNACFSPRIADARPCYDCPQPPYVPKYRKKVLKLSGNVKKTEVRNDDGDLTSILYTYNVCVNNCTGYPIDILRIAADIRILECGAERPLIGQGDCSCCFNTKDIDVLVQNKSQMCKCECDCKCKKDRRDCVEFDCNGIWIKLHDVAPGKSIVTVVVPLFNKHPKEPFPCTMLPALFTASIVQCLCDEERVLFQNSILIGEQPEDVECDEDSESSDDCCSDDCHCDE